MEWAARRRREGETEPAGTAFIETRYRRPIPEILKNGTDTALIGADDSVNNSEEQS